MNAVFITINKTQIFFYAYVLDFGDNIQFLVNRPYPFVRMDYATDPKSVEKVGLRFSQQWTECFFYSSYKSLFLFLSWGLSLKYVRNFFRNT